MTASPIRYLTTSSNANDNIADEAESAAFHDLSGKPAGHCADRDRGSRCDNAAARGDCHQTTKNAKTRVAIPVMRTMMDEIEVICGR